MKSKIITTALTALATALLLSVAPARAEFLDIQIKTFGMD